MVAALLYPVDHAIAEVSLGKGPTVHPDRWYVHLLDGSGQCYGPYTTLKMAIRVMVERLPRTRAWRIEYLKDPPERLRRPAA